MMIIQTDKLIRFQNGMGDKGEYHGRTFILILDLDPIPKEQALIETIGGNAVLLRWGDPSTQEIVQMFNNFVGNDRLPAVFQNRKSKLWSIPYHLNWVNWEDAKF